MPNSAAWKEKNDDPLAFTVWLSLYGSSATAGMQGLVIMISTACPLLAIKHPPGKTIFCRNHGFFGRCATGPSRFLLRLEKYLFVSVYDLLHLREL
jgi:hypothetical protein